MFDQLSDKLQHALRMVRGHTQLSDKNTQETFAEIRRALLKLM